MFGMSPIAYLTDVQDSSTQQQNLVPFTHFATDLAAGNLPNYSFITPNGCNDGHDCGLSTADSWLKSNNRPVDQKRRFPKRWLADRGVSMNPAVTTPTAEGRVVSALISPAFLQARLSIKYSVSTRERVAAHAGRPGRHRASRRGFTVRRPCGSSSTQQVAALRPLHAHYMFRLPARTPTRARFPLRGGTVQKAFNSATAGKTVCLRGGTYPQYMAATSGFNQVENNSGSSGNPIVFTNLPR